MNHIDAVFDVDQACLSNQLLEEVPSISRASSEIHEEKREVFLQIEVPRESVLVVEVAGERSSVQLDQQRSLFISILGSDEKSLGLAVYSDCLDFALFEDVEKSLEFVVEVRGSLLKDLVGLFFQKVPNQNPGVKSIAGLDNQFVLLEPNYEVVGPSIIELVVYHLIGLQVENSDGRSSLV